MQIIKQIDEEFIKNVKAAYPAAEPAELARKIDTMRVLENYVEPAAAAAAAAVAAKVGRCRLTL